MTKWSMGLGKMGVHTGDGRLENKKGIGDSYALKKTGGLSPASGRINPSPCSCLYSFKSQATIDTWWVDGFQYRLNGKRALVNSHFMRLGLGENEIFVTNCRQY